LAEGLFRGLSKQRKNALNALNFLKTSCTLHIKRHVQAITDNETVHVSMQHLTEDKLVLPGMIVYRQAFRSLLIIVD
jgi:hypothetical protein